MNSSNANQWFAQPDVLSLLFLLPIMTVLSIVANRRRRRALVRLGRLPALAALTERRRQWSGLRLFCLSMALSILAVGIAGPQWGREPVVAVAHGRDLVVVMDLSRSMLADDVLPNRLERAQKAVEELIVYLKRHGGHRLALVAYAGRARIVCPLTHDYDHFLEKLLELDAEHLPPELRPGPEAVSGTRIGAGLELAVEAHDERFRGQQVQDILLLSDGDDPANDNEWFNGIRAALSAGIAIYTVGIGDPDEGRPIPVAERGFLTHDGKVVKTKLTERPLKEIAEQTRGTYTAARTGAVSLVELFRNQIEPGRKRESVDEAPPVYRQRYAWFFGAALLLLILEMTCGARARRPKKVVVPNNTRAADARSPTVVRAPVQAVALVLLTMFLIGAATKLAPEELVRLANAAFDRQEYDAALKLYTEAEATIENPGLVSFNKGAALYRLGRFRDAQLHYQRCLDEADSKHRPALLFNLGNTLLQQAQAGGDLSLFREALQAYQKCVGEPEAEASLRASARHNLELTKLLWLQARLARPNQPEKEPGSDTNPEPPRPEKDPKDQEKVGEGGDNNPGQMPKPIMDKRGKADKKEGPDKAIETPETAPGKGHVPPPPDDAKLKPMSREDAERNVQDGAKRIREERFLYRQRAAPAPLRGVPDW
jgi:Ca-activated chloride channel family protein